MLRHRPQGLIVFGLCAAVLLAAPPFVSAQPAQEPSTPPEMVATYNSLADGILALKRSEEHLVVAILAAGHAHGQALLGRAQRAIATNDAAAARSAIEALAATVGQMATEGDGAVAVVRKRLLEGGHHHNAAGEAQGLFDQGYVVVTKAAKQKWLDSSRAIGQLARAPKADALESEWKKVQAVFTQLVKPAP